MIAQVLIHLIGSRYLGPVGFAVTASISTSSDTTTTVTHLAECDVPDFARMEFGVPPGASRVLPGGASSTITTGNVAASAQII